MTINLYLQRIFCDLAVTQHKDEVARLVHFFTFYVLNRVTNVMIYDFEQLPYVSDMLRKVCKVCRVMLMYFAF